jgi:hypothetical protein
VTGWPDGSEQAPLDYLSILPAQIYSGTVMSKGH